MQLVAPEILQAALGLSAAPCVMGLVVGLALWLTGWCGHRFWIVLVTTVTAGIMGILSAHTPLNGMKPLASGLLLAIAAGVLALALIRLIAFAAGGAITCLLVHGLAPESWQEPFGWFLVGGLVTLVSFRFCTMTFTSLGGSMLMMYSFLLLLDHFGRLEAVAVSEQRVRLLNSACIGMTLVGLFFQYLIERRRARKQKEIEDQERQRGEWERERTSRQRPGWLTWGKAPTRRAG